MWMAVSTAFTGITLIMLLRFCKRNKSAELNILLLILWSRFALSSMPEFSFEPLVGGITLNALYSLGVSAFGLVFLIPKHAGLKYLPSIYLFLFFVVLSGVLQHLWSGVFYVLTKWIFFLTVALLFFLCSARVGEKLLLDGVIRVFMLPVGLQLLSFALGEYKATENDGSRSYIGGYYHEAVFSTMILMYLICAIIREGKQGAHFLTGVFGLILANYRTTILAALPVIWLAINEMLKRFLGAKLRIPALLLAVSLGAAVLVPLVGQLVAERFADIGTIVMNWQDLIKSYQYYTAAEQDIFSSRLYVWSQYITDYVNADLLVHLFGFGPDAWTSHHPKYAHNTFVSYLYEFGLVGLIAFCAMILINLYWAVRYSDSKDLFYAHCAFLVMNLSTMPFWQIEGLMLYALLCGIGWQRASAQRAAVEITTYDSNSTRSPTFSRTRQVAASHP